MMRALLCSWPLPFGSRRTRMLVVAFVYAEVVSVGSTEGRTNFSGSNSCGSIVRKLGIFIRYKCWSAPGAGPGWRGSAISTKRSVSSGSGELSRGVARSASESSTFSSSPKRSSRGSSSSASGGGVLISRLRSSASLSPCGASSDSWSEPNIVS